jgi:hypothetical protein
MSELFELEWMGGVAEHHYRKARPGVDDFPWQTLKPETYLPALVFATQKVWTGVAISEYAAIAAFSEVVSALALAKAPLDLIGMTSDFLADEVRHVELVSRLVMQLGGATPRRFEPEKLTAKLDDGLTPFQRANELALRVGCIAEAFAGSTAAPMMRESTHPLIRAVYQSILRDEARHRRFGTLYFQWAGDRLDQKERERLGRSALSALETYAPLWQKHSTPTRGEHTREGWAKRDIHDLGWFETARYTPLAKSVVRDDIVPTLREIGIHVPSEPLAKLLDD